jgi:hypothetical protein
MARRVLQAVVACALIGLGWAAAKAQTAAPDFELFVDAPAGETRIECVRGCALAWSERGINPNARPELTFSYSCSGANVQRCSSGRVGGWVKR